MSTLVNDPFFEQAVICWPRDRPSHILKIKNQEKTKSSYAFTVVNTVYADLFPRIEDAVLRGKDFGNTAQEASEGSTQELIDHLHKKFPTSGRSASDEPDENGWSNNLKNAFTYIQNNGLYRNYQYPFVGIYQSNGHLVTSQPNQPECKIFIQRFEKINYMDYDRVVQQLAQQPLTGGVRNYESFSKWDPSTGVYQGPNDVEKNTTSAEPSKIAMVIVGCGVENGITYYICQNSVGVDWGHKGYIKVARNLVDNIMYPVGSHLQLTGGGVFNDN